jgi:hypothetical protein
MQVHLDGAFREPKNAGDLPVARADFEHRDDLMTARSSSAETGIRRERRTFSIQWLLAL